MLAIVAKVLLASFSTCTIASSTDDDINLLRRKPSEQLMGHVENDSAPLGERAAAAEIIRERMQREYAMRMVKVLAGRYDDILAARILQALIAFRDRRVLPYLDAYRRYAMDNYIRMPGRINLLLTNAIAACSEKSK